MLFAYSHVVHIHVIQTVDVIVLDVVAGYEVHVATGNVISRVIQAVRTEESQTHILKVSHYFLILQVVHVALPIEFNPSSLRKRGFCLECIGAVEVEVFRLKIDSGYRQGKSGSLQRAVGVLYLRVGYMHFFNLHIHRNGRC